MPLDNREPIRIAHCTWATGIGGGVARFDACFNRYLNRDLFYPEFVVTKERVPGEVMFDDSVPFIYTGDRNRFSSLLKIFADVDVVSFQGGFDPLICEAARASCVPVLVEIIHTIEPGGLYPYIDMTVCISESVRQVQPTENKTEVIYNGIDIGQFTFRAGPNKKGKIIILQVANRDKPYFNLDDLADEVLPIDPRIELWLAGGGQEGKSTGRIKFFGLHPNICDLYQKADILTMFTRREAFGLALVEGMASGAVPVVIDENGPKEIVTDASDGFISPSSNKEDIVETIRKAVNVRDGEKWESMRREARKTIEQKFTINKCMTEYEQIYLEIVDRKGRRKKRGATEVEALPEVDVGEAVQFFNDGNLDMMEKSMRRMAGRSAPIKEKNSVWAASRLADQISLHGDRNVAGMVYSKLHGSGFKTADRMKNRLSAGSDDAEAVMVLAERQIQSGWIDKAVKTLEEGIRLYPQSQALSETLDILKRKLSL